MGSFEPSKRTLPWRKRREKKTAIDLRGRLLVALVDRDVLVQLGDFLRQSSSVCLCLLDSGDELLHLRRRLLDRALLLNGRVVAELLVRSELHLLLVFLLLPLLGHALEELNDLLFRMFFQRRSTK